MKKTLLFVLALCLGIPPLTANPVEVFKARRLGWQFVSHKAFSARNAADDLSLAYTFRADNGTATAYVFNFSGGFVVVAADDAYSPILGYSDCGHFDYDRAPDGLLFMLGELSSDVAETVANRRVVSSEVVCQWKNLEAFGILHPDRGAPVVGPLVQQKWNQDPPYNMYVPNGYPTGCVATAMAQLMKYWEWPTTGTGEHSYQWNGQTLSANFGETTYDWANMIDFYGSNASQEQKEAVATLMWHCGVAVDMNYASDGSGAYSVDVPAAISEYFSYSEHAEHIAKAGYAYNDWIALLKSNIDQQIPLYYSGQSTSGGHAFICDGYDVDGLFHFNWGWGGSSNGYFRIDGEDFEYSGGQAIVYDFIPNTVYNQMPKAAESLSVGIDSDVSLVGHLSWTNPTETVTGEALGTIEKVLVKRNGKVVGEVAGVAPGQAVTYDDEVPYFDQFEYTVQVVNGGHYGRTVSTTAVFGPYCGWKVTMTSSNFLGWDGGGITVQNAAGSYIDFLTTNTASASLQIFQMALGNNNLYWTAPNSSISSLSFKIRDADNQVVYQYEGSSSGLEPGLIKTLNNSCGNENICESPYNLKAVIDPENDRTVILTWDSDHTPEFGYCIYRDGYLFNMAHDKQYIDADTEIGGHCYYITALCNGGETDNSNEYCITSGTGCDAPIDLYFNYTTNNKVQLYWTVPETEGVSGYEVYRKTDETPFKLIKRVVTNNYRDNSAIPGTHYQYAVKAVYNEIGCSSAYANDRFDADKFYIDVEWLNAPADLQAVLDEVTMTVNLQWKPAFQADFYKLTRNGLTISEMTETVFTDESLEAGQTYCYQVEAFGDGFDNSSEEVCVETPVAPEPPVLPCPAPYDFRYTHVPADRISLTWSHPIEERLPDHFILTVIDHLAGDTTDVAVTMEDNFLYQEVINTNGMDKSFKIRAVYSDCESEYGSTEAGEDFIRFCNLAIGENPFDGLKLYPNPVTGRITVEAQNAASVAVHNLVGQCVAKQVLVNGSTQIDMETCPNGVYFVKVSDGISSIVRKIVKM